MVLLLLLLQPLPLVFSAVLGPLPGIPKLEHDKHKDGHAWLARETARDPEGVETDRASDG